MNIEQLVLTLQEKNTGKNIRHGNYGDHKHAKVKDSGYILFQDVPKSETDPDAVISSIRESNFTVYLEGVFDVDKVIEWLSGCPNEDIVVYSLKDINDTVLENRRIFKEREDRMLELIGVTGLGEHYAVGHLLQGIAYGYPKCCIKHYAKRPFEPKKSGYLACPECSNKSAEQLHMEINEARVSTIKEWDASEGFDMYLTTNDIHRSEEIMTKAIPWLKELWAEVNN